MGRHHSIIDCIPVFPFRILKWFGCCCTFDWDSENLMMSKINDFLSVSSYKCLLFAGVCNDEICTANVFQKVLTTTVCNRASPALVVWIGVHSNNQWQLLQFSVFRWNTGVGGGFGEDDTATLLRVLRVDLNGYQVRAAVVKMLVLNLSLDWHVRMEWDRMFRPLIFPPCCKRVISTCSLLNDATNLADSAR